jgi:hypothetical protein
MKKFLSTVGTASDGEGAKRIVEERAAIVQQWNFPIFVRA